jgi:hypothetical protein
LILTLRIAEQIVIDGNIRVMIIAARGRVGNSAEAVPDRAARAGIGVGRGGGTAPGGAGPESAAVPSVCSFLPSISFRRYPSVGSCEEIFLPSVVRPLAVD